MKHRSVALGSSETVVDKRRGIGLIITVFAAAVLFGILALTFDLGRIYIAQNELQTFTDAAALAATLELDGTEEGVVRARDVAETFPNRWTFGSQAVSDPTVYFAEVVDGPWLETPPAPPQDYRFVRVEAEGPVQLFFLPILSVLTGTSSSSSQQAFAATGPGPLALAIPGVINYYDVGADSGAGQLRKSVFQQGLLPYSPHAHLDEDRDPVINTGFAEQDPFNFEVGRQYTIRWPPPGQRSNNLEGRCEGDIFDPNAGELLFDPPMPAAPRGFIDIGAPTFNWNGANGSAFIREAIVSNTQSHGIAVGEPVVHVNGQRSTEDAALRERISQDDDPYSRTYAEYLANTDANGKISGTGRRIVFIPVQNSWDEDRVVEFSTFFLPPEDEVCCPAGPGLCGNGQGGGSGGAGAQTTYGFGSGGATAAASGTMAAASGTTANAGNGGGGGGGNSPKPCCAEYIGSGIMYGLRRAASSEVAVYVPRLTQ